MAWDPDLYRRFKAERFLPFEDLFSLVKIHEEMRVIDLGCGTGELTVLLSSRLPGSAVTGVDTSAEMLEQAELRKGSGVEFRPGRIEEAEGEWDLVFSHAALHWVEDHETLIPALFSLVAPGGQIAFQIPDNNRHPSHTLIVETALEDPFRSALSGWYRSTPVLDIERYATLLFEAGGEEITAMAKVYCHLLPEGGTIADWTSGTTLVPYFERLPEELREPFVDDTAASSDGHSREARSCTHPAGYFLPPDALAKGGGSKKGSECYPFVSLFHIER